MKKIILTLLIAVISSASSFALDKYTINRDELPVQAQEMLRQYFPKAKIGMIKVDKHLLKKTDFDVKLVDGSTIEFNNAGKWTSVDCKKKEVPDGLVPKAVRSYIKKNFNELKVVKIEKKSSGYEIGLSDGVKLKFNLLGQFKGAKIEH